MILSCPECATSYFVDDAQIPPAGRTVKCASCGARWRAEPPPPEVEAEPEVPPQEVEDVAEPTAEPDIDPAAPAADIVAEVVAEDTGLRPRPATFRRSPPPKRPSGGAAVTWIAVAAVLVLLVGAALALRREVVRLVPQSAPAFAAIGLPVDRLGLVIGDIEAQPVLQGGRPVLTVTGSIQNTRDTVVKAPPLRISLMDKAGKPLAARLVRPLNAEVPAGAKRYFAVSIPDPPAGSQDLEVVFDAAATVAPPGQEAAPAVLAAEPPAPAAPAPDHHG